MNPPENEWESLEELRQRTRETLNRPYNIPEFKEKPVSVETANDPFAGIFKPFGNATAEEVTVTVNRKLERFSLRDVIVPVFMTILVLGGVLAWQAYQQNLVQGIVTPFPTNQNASESQPAAEVVPPGTELEPGGPYTGTGGTQPTNLNGSGGGSSGGGGSGSGNNGGTGAVNPPASECPSGKVCSGTALDGTECTVSSPCTLIRPDVTESFPPTVSRIIDGQAPDGSPCTPAQPCILIHE
jgi:hypothetical protein